MVESLSNLYTTEAEIKKLMRSADVDTLLDDSGSGSATSDALNDVIERATDHINQYCLGLYSVTQLEASLWVRHRATVAACYFLSMRRGQSLKYQAEFERITAELERVMNQELFIPRLNRRVDNSVAVSNYIVDDTGENPADNLRVERDTSVGPNYPGIKADDYPY